MLRPAKLNLVLWFDLLPHILVLWFDLLDSSSCYSLPTAAHQPQLSNQVEKAEKAEEVILMRMREYINRRG